MKKSHKHNKYQEDNNIADKGSIDHNSSQSSSFHDENITTNEQKNSHTKENNSSQESAIKIPKELTQAVTEIDQKLQDYGAIQDKYLMLQADFENYKKRAQREKEETIKYAAGDIVKSLLPVLDNFQLGLKAASSNETVAKGFQLIFDQLKNVLKSKGVQEISPINEIFNPQIHDAVAYINHNEIAADHVIETLRAGYQLNGKLLRPANVVVSKGKADE
jgi:molecular chaperone GrpE